MNIRRSHNLGLDEARRRVDEVADDICGKYGLKSSWEGDELKIRGSGVNGCLRVAEHTVDIDVKLGFALSMMSGAIRSSIEESLDSHLL